MMRTLHRAVFLLFLFTSVAHAGEIRGKVVSVFRGEPLRQVRVLVVEAQLTTTTANDGSFKIENVPVGKYTLQVSVVGYRLVEVPFAVTEGPDVKEFSITMAPVNFRRTDVVDVKGDIFHGENPAIPSQINLTAAEIKEAGTVLADDPFRAVQALPGVAPSDNNDFFGEFAVLGAPFTQVGIYVDDVVVPSPFHTVPGLRDGASLSVFSSETVEELNLMPLAFPLRYADAAGAALAVTTREGSRTKPLFTVSLGLADTNIIAEGELGGAKKGSWLASARKSYLGYLVHREGGDPFTDVAFEDGDVKLNYDLTSRHSLSLYAIDGHSDFDQSVPQADANTLNTGGNDFNLVRLGWRFAITPHLLLDTTGAYIRERFDIRNLFNQVLRTDDYGEWLGSTRVSWNWRKDQLVEAGYTARRLRDSGHSASFSDQGVEVFGVGNGTGLRQSGYVQQVSGLFNNRLRLMGGVRWDRLEQIAAQPVSAQASAAWQLASRTQLQFGFGRYAQFPDFQSLVFPCPAVVPPPPFDSGFGLVERSNHFTAAVEQRIGENTRVRVEAFDRENYELPGRLSADACTPIQPASSSLFNLKDNARGAQLILQRRSANRLSGWLGYTLTYARQRLPVFQGSSLSQVSFVDAPTEADQRHTLNAFATYRITPTINWSAKWLYGSGFPITPLDFQVVGDSVVTTGPGRRLGPYERLDVRCDKAWVFRHWKMTLYAEGLNMTNHNNPRFVLVSIDSTGHATAVTEKGLPITPTAGLVFEF
jgi:hypothetical protein